MPRSPLGWIALAALTLAHVGCAVSNAPDVQEQRLLGVRDDHWIRQRFSLVRDRSVVRYVRALGKELVASTGRSSFEPGFFVVEDSVPGVFAMAGGNLYVSTGLLLEVRDPDELAGALTHVLAHVAALHVGPQYQSAGNRPDAFASPFSTAAEREANELAIPALERSGHDPSAFARLVERLRALPVERTGPLENRMVPFLAVHPLALDAQTDAAGTASEAEAARLREIQERIRLIVGA